ncbi:MAG: DMT family transporter [Pseudomonadota bacterium]
MEQSRPLMALAYMMGATASFTFMAIAGRELAFQLSTFEIMTYRSMIGVVVVLIIAWARGLLPQIKARRPGLHAVRNLSHFAGQNLWFYAIGFISFAQLFAFEFSVPLWVALFAPLFLSERLTATRIAAAGIGFLGILIVARPDQLEIGPGLIAAFLCAIGFAGANIGTKLLTRTETTISIMFWLTALQLIYGLIACAIFTGLRAPTTAEWPWVAIVAVCGLTAHYCITSALSLAPATVVAPLDFARLPVIAVIGMLFYDEPLVALTFLGAAVIFGANYLNIRAEQRRNGPA